MKDASPEKDKMGGKGDRRSSYTHVTDRIAKPDGLSSFMHTQNTEALNRGFQALDVFGYVLLITFFVLSLLGLKELHNAIHEQLFESFAIWLRHFVECDTCLSFSLLFITIFVVGIIILLRRERRVFLVDFVTYKPKSELEVPIERFMDIMEKQRDVKFTGESINFMNRLVERTGLGAQTYFPPGILSDPPELNMKTAREESEMVMFTCLENLFANTGLKPGDIDILIINCSLFCPTPSLTSMCVNKFKMKSSILTYSLGGMGCSAGLISIHLAKDLLQVHKNANAVVISYENITQNWYFGNEKAMLIPNTLFRLGGAAVLLSNKLKFSWGFSKAKYELEHAVRTHKGADNVSYNAVFEKEDSCGFRGVALSKDIMDVAGVALQDNITSLGPSILPIFEQLKYFLTVIGRKVYGKKIKIHVPNFKSCVQHFCIHAGGRAVIDALEKALSLKEFDCMPSRYALNRYGNTSSSSIWYELEFIEKYRTIRKSDRVWQMAFGSGFKCNSAVWRACRYSKGEGDEMLDEAFKKDKKND